MIIEKNRVVTLAYQLSNKEGVAIDISNGEPLVYLHGYNQLITGLEQQLEGRAEGDKFVAEVPASLAFGDRNEELIQAVPIEKFKGVERLEAGMHFEAQGENGVHSVRIHEVNGNKVTIDANHPLAGVDLVFDIDIQSVRIAKDDEIPAT